MRTSIAIAFLGGVVAASTVFAALVNVQVADAQSGAPGQTGAIPLPRPATLEGFSAPTEIRFDESMGEKKPTPVIPKSWQFVGVSNGNSPNSNNLWFRDAAGNVFMLQGFTDRGIAGEFCIGPSVQVLHSK